MIHMRPYTAREASNVEFLVEKQIDFATVQATFTGLRKSILDATAPVRAYLKEKGLHDYEQQLQGPVHKRMVETFILTESEQFYTRTSLYRPLTKKGDPRLWVNKVREVEFLRPDDIFILIVHESRLYVVNITAVDVRKVCEAAFYTPLKKLVEEISTAKMSASEELLSIIRDSMTDWIPTEVTADTGVGRTIESMLGLRMNSSKNPDYKGIEIKSHRGVSKVRNTLFTQTPDWTLSRLKSGREIVAEYGYVPQGCSHKSLHVTLSADRPNNQRLGLLVSPQKGLLEADEFMPDPLADGSFVKLNDVVVWRLIQLHERLLTKHRETFWIDVQTRKDGAREFFRVTDILHTKNPIVPQFDVLLEQGDITVDLLLCRDSGGDTYSFKIKAKARSFLFPKSTTYSFREC